MKTTTKAILINMITFLVLLSFMVKQFRISIILIISYLLIFQILFLPVSACSVMEGTYGKAFMSIYNKNGNFIEEKDLGPAGWGPDCALGRDLYQYNQDSFYLMNNGKLTQYILDPLNYNPVPTTTVINVSNEEYFSQQRFTGITNNFVYFANQTTIPDNWTINVSILIQNVTNSVWNNYIINIEELLQEQGYFNNTNEIFSINKFNFVETSYYGSWMLNWGKIMNKTYVIITNLENKADSIYLVDNKIETNPVLNYSRIITNGKYLVSFASDLFTINEIFVLNLESLENYTITIPSTTSYKIDHLITYNPVPVLANNIIYIQTYPMYSIFRIELDTNTSSMFFNSTDISLTHFSVLEPYIIITTLRLYNDITSISLTICIIFVYVNIAIGVLFLLKKLVILISKK